MGWMYWTLPTALFFGSIFLLLVSMGIWELVSPTDFRRGYIIPMKTTRGDRLFISLLSMAYITAIWVALIPLTKWILIPIAIVWVVLLIAVG
ncbi:hypothetical protein HKX42_08180 [Salinisphaera sp. USBA-960]|nr:hypothetical protein [Salifodinibacter halophilus]NNC26850.1 hypothetical protein [Salifodinibacter halophilus]